MIDARLKDPFGGNITEGNMTTVIDNASDTVIYIGKAQVGTATDSDKWQIKKILINGTVTTIAWAGGTDRFDKTWNSRSSYVYS